MLPRQCAAQCRRGGLGGAGDGDVVAADGAAADVRGGGRAGRGRPRQHGVHEVQADAADVCGGGGHKGLVILIVLFRTGPPSFLYLSFSISFPVVTL